MTVIAYHLGLVSTDDYSLIKTLVLPSNAEDDVPITFHEDGVDYQVPASHIFAAARILYRVSNASILGRIGESASADGAIATERIQISNSDTDWHYEDVGSIFTASTYITGESNNSYYYLYADTTLYGAEIDTS